MAKFTTAMSTVTAHQHIFAVFGLPEQVGWDNGPQFTSEEFTQFMHANGRSIADVPYHSSSNGAVERFVGTFKQLWGQRNTTDFQLDISPRTSSCPIEQHHRLQLVFLPVIAFQNNVSKLDLICSNQIWQRMSIISMQFRKPILICTLRIKV